MRSAWTLWVSPESNDTCLYKTHRGQTQRQRTNQASVEAHMEVMQAEVTGRLGPPEARRRCRRILC